MDQRGELGRRLDLAAEEELRRTGLGEGQGGTMVLASATVR